MILPINIYPSITSYIHHSYVNAIIESNELLNLYVKDIGNYVWLSNSIDIDYRIKDDCLYLIGDTKKYVYYKVVKKNMVISAYISTNGEKWLLLAENIISNDINYKDIVLTLHIYFGNEQYLTWKYMNFLHLVYRKEDFNGINLDYYIFPRKDIDASYNSYCHFIDTTYDDYNDYTTIFSSIQDYIKWNIDHSYYVNVCLDEFYLGKTNAHYNHFSLIYGYDNENSIYNILKINSNGKLIKTTIDYDVFSVDKIITSNIIVKYRLNINASVASFNIQLFTLQIKEFVAGIDPSIRSANILTHQKGVYGLQIFYELMYTQEGRNKLIEDRRISFVLYEHCCIMKDRLYYLVENEFLKSNDIDKLVLLCAEMLITSEMLKNLVIKNMVLKNLESDIMKKLELLFSQETFFYSTLLLSFRSC